MSEQFIPHPPSPQPPKASNMKQMAAIVFLIGAVALLIGILIAPGDKSSAPDTTIKSAPVITASPAPVVNKYDQYLEHVYNNSGQANTISKATLIEYGDTICQALDQGKTVAWIVNYLTVNGSGKQSDVELYASVVYGAIHYICSEYTGDLNLYLNN